MWNGLSIYKFMNTNRFLGTLVGYYTFLHDNIKNLIIFILSHSDIRVYTGIMRILPGHTRSQNNR